MQRKVDFSLGEHFHLYSRRVDKRQIYIDDHDRDRFVKLLYICNGSKSFKFRDFQNKNISEIDPGEKLVAIGAYCLMPNHFHLLVRQQTEDGITKFMKKLLTGYSSYFNKRHGRTGALLEGVFKAEHAASDEYLKYIFSYIHLNPVKLFQSDWRQKGIADVGLAKEYLEKYKYSSYVDYLEKDRDEKAILEKHAFPNYWHEVSSMATEVNGWLELK